MQLVLVRHTRLDLKKGICYGRTDIQPAGTFLSEAGQIAKKLSKFRFDEVFTSPLQRCTRLADHLGYMQAVIDRRLIELNFGDWEMKPWNSITGEYAERWMNDYLHLPCPGGESMQDLIIRVSGFYNVIKERSGTLLIFTHSGPIRAFHHIVHPEKFPSDELFGIQIGFGSVITLNC